MSSEAVSWAFQQDIKPSSLKLTLLALCECSNYQTGRIMPSVAHICQMTGQNRKTVIANVAALEVRGLIVDTGKKVGRTGQIKVYLAMIEAAEDESEESQKRDTIPKTGPLKSTVFTRKESQKRDTEPSMEPPSKEIEDAREQILPDDWKPELFTNGTKSRAIESSWTEDQRQHHIEHFTAHHTKFGSQFKNWQAAWATWVLNTTKFQRGNYNGNDKPRTAQNDGSENPYITAILERKAARAAALR